MDIETRRIFDEEGSSGYRVLVDRLWPRGISKEDAQLDEWAKELAPSESLRKWFGHDPAKWDEFRRHYAAELDDRSEVVEELRKRLDDESLPDLVVDVVGDEEVEELREAQRREAIELGMIDESD